MCNWICPLSVDWGSIADWGQAIAGFLAVLVVRRVWIHQAEFTRNMEENQAQRARTMHEEQGQLVRDMQKDQSELAIRTQRQSLRPKLQLIKNIDAGEVAKFAIKLSNAGLGPAVIKDIRISYEGECITGSANRIGLEFLSRIAKKAGVPGFHQNNRIPVNGVWIPKGEILEILGGEFIGKEIVDRLSADRGAAIEGVLEPVKIEIVYESVFEEPFTATI